MSETRRHEYRAEAHALAAIGQVLALATLPAVDVTLPRDLAERAVAAWHRDDDGSRKAERLEERIERHRAGTLALIGLSIVERGRRWTRLSSGCVVVGGTGRPTMRHGTGRSPALFPVPLHGRSHSLPDVATGRRADRGAGRRRKRRNRFAARCLLPAVRNHGAVHSDPGPGLSESRGQSEVVPRRGAAAPFRCAARHPARGCAASSVRSERRVTGPGSVRRKATSWFIAVLTRRSIAGAASRVQS